MAWMNTGAAFPESQALMERVSKLVPHFIEVKSDVMTDVLRNGWPVDVLPISHTPQGLHDGLSIRLRSWFDCCANNMWYPMQAKMRELGVTEIIRGQRKTEHYKSPLRDGNVVEGVTYRFPIQNWTEQQVFEYLTARGVEIPAYYDYTHTSLDCWLCTAYLDVKGGQVRYMKEHHPNKHAVLIDKLTEIRTAIDRANQPLHESLKL